MGRSEQAGHGGVDLSMDYGRAPQNQTAFTLAYLLSLSTALRAMLAINQLHLCLLEKELDLGGSSRDQKRDL